MLIYMYCFGIENAYTHNGQITNPTERNLLVII